MSKKLHDEIMNLIYSQKNFDHEKLKTEFGGKGWNTEEHLAGKGETEKDWRYDAFKDKVAVEIEKGGQAYRSFLKFMLGYNMGKVDVGVLICPWRESGTKGHPMSVTERELKDLKNILPVPILLVGVA